MTNLRAKMFNKRASGPKSKPEMVIKALDLKAGKKIADIGAGGGYFSIKFGSKVGESGIVYAIDINPEFLKFIRDESNKNHLKNIKVVLSEKVFETIPKKSLDLIFIRNVLHHIPDRIDYFKRMVQVLRVDGQVAILDYNSNGRFSFHKLFGHYIPKEEIIQLMKDAGYELNESFDFLPEQSFLIFNIRSNGVYN